MGVLERPVDHRPGLSMTGRLTVWHGTEQECTELMDAMRHAAFTTTDAREVLGDQRIIDGLLFARRTRERWRRGEWIVPRRRDQ